MNSEGAMGPEEAKIRAQTGVGLFGVESPWVAKPYASDEDRDPCPWCGKKHRAKRSPKHAENGLDE